MSNNFHGRTITVVSFSTDALYRDGFGPFTPGFKTVPFGDARALEAAIDKHTVGVLLEPIQAEAGILIPPAGYLPAVKKLCEDKDVLLLLDEIQTGLGRTGKDFCFEHEGIRPDVLILGKSEWDTGWAGGRSSFEKGPGTISPISSSSIRSPARMSRPPSMRMLSIISGDIGG
jgi:acetylornithine/succinyldiaminopimelate/putrescine aminotransferase